MRLTELVPRVIFLLLAASSAGCKFNTYADDQGDKPLPPPPKLEPAPKATWDTKYAIKLQFVGGGKELEKAHCEFKLLGRKEGVVLDIDCAHLPHPTDVTFAGATKHNGDSEYDHFEFTGDFAQRLSTSPLDGLKDQFNLKMIMPVDVTIAIGGYEPMKVSPPALWTSVDVFKVWAGKPVSFSETPRADDGKKSAVLVHEGYSGLSLVGEGTLLDDLDFIAVQRDQESPAISCFGGRLVYRTEADVTLYDRRNGGVVDTHHFKATNAGCPASALVSTNTEYQSAVSPDQVKPWLKTRIKK